MTALKFLLDVNVGKTVRRFLADQGYAVTSVIDIDPRMPDEDILRLAHRGKAVLITCDKDFGALIFKRRFPHNGVVRLEDTTPDIQIEYLKTILKQHAGEISKNIIVAQNRIIRIRKA